MSSGTDEVHLLLGAVARRGAVEHAAGAQQFGLWRGGVHRLLGLGDGRQGGALHGGVVVGRAGKFGEDQHPGAGGVARHQAAALDGQRRLRQR